MSAEEFSQPGADVELARQVFLTGAARAAHAEDVGDQDALAEAASMMVDGIKGALLRQGIEHFQIVYPGEPIPRDMEEIDRRLTQYLNDNGSNEGE